MVYNSRLEMTYLVITSQIDIADDSINNLISKLWDKDINQQKIQSNPDFHIIDAREENSIGIEEVKSLQEDMRYKPFQENVQIAIILDAKKLTIQAQNAFLKTLEDSSDQTAYILLTRNEKDLLPTIVSRSKKIYSKNKDRGINSENKDSVCFDEDDLIYCFSVFEKVAKDKMQTLQYLDTYLNSLQNELRNGIKKGTDIDDITEKISLVNITKGQVSANGNRRLLLENLYLQIHNIA
jgi:DNA polymerase III delta prime subunit